MEASRLNSWKEIATYFDKDVRTVRRWEAVRGLPIHRVPGGQRGGVYAYVSELQDWLHAGQNAADENAADEMLAGDAYSESDSGEIQVFAVEDAPVVEAAAPKSLKVRVGRRWVWIWVAILLAAVLLAGYGLKRRAMESQNLHASLSDDAEAQELYLRAQYLWNQQTDASLTEAADLYRQAIAKDTSFAAAYAGLADSYILLRQYGSMTDGEAFPKALEASRQALKLDDKSPEAHRAYAFVLNYWIWDFPAAEQEFERAIALRPGDSQTHHWYATSLFSTGRYQEAMREIDTARRLKPDSIAILSNRGLLLTRIDAEAALKYLLQVERINPGFPPVHTYLANIYLSRGLYDEYFEEAGKAAELRHRTQMTGVLAEAKAAWKKDGVPAMMRSLAQGVGLAADAGAPDAMPAAGFWMRAGDEERALHYLGVAAGRRDPGFLGIDRDPVFAPLAGNARYEALVKQRDTPIVVGGL